MPSITSDHSMVKDEFPTGSILKEVSILEDQEFGCDELCCDRVQLIFPDAAVILQPLADTDEIEIVISSAKCSARILSEGCDSVSEARR